MRNFTSNSKIAAENELREGEILLDLGEVGEDAIFHGYSAVSDEDFIPDKEAKLNHRRQKRKEKRGRNYYYQKDS